VSRTTAPPPDVVEGLRPYRLRACHHEAGHAVVALAAGCPVRSIDVWDEHRRPWFGSEYWSVTGFTSVDPPDSTIGMLIAVAGIEAEACWEAAVHGGSAATYRRAARTASRSDRRLIDGYAPGSQISERDAVRRAGGLLVDHWPLVEEIAAAVDEHGHLTARDLRRIL
jgi:hypothetical protein